MNAEEKKAPKQKKMVKVSSAKKRDLQSKKRNSQRRSSLSKIKTGIKSFTSSLEKEDSSFKQTKLSSLYSLLDKGTKKNLLKKNKANRLKSKLSLLLQKKG